MSEIALRNVCKQFDSEHYGVKDFNLDIHDKEFVIFVGPSGCGKSTTLRIIAGLEEITDGELWIDGELSNYLEPKERGMSMVFQNYALYPNMTVYGNMAYALKIRKMPKDEIDKKVHEVAKILEIEQLLDRKPAALSGGQKQRVAIGSAIIRKPKAFLMDEPLSNLDAKLRAQMRVELVKLHKQLDTTIIYVTHDQTEAMTLGTKIVVMKDGLIQQVGAPQSIYDNPVNLFVAGFLGSPSMNFFQCTVKAEENNRTALLLDDAKTVKKVYLDGTRGKQIADRYNGRHVILGIRPEDIYELEEAKKLGIENDSVDVDEPVVNREMLGAEVIPVTTGTATLKDAVSEAMREWTSRIADTHYCLGSVMGPHPFPTIVRDFQAVISKEIKEQILQKEGRLPDAVIACVGGGSNAIGSFYHFIEDKKVRLIGCEAAGRGIDTDETAATITTGRLGIFHGMKSYFCQDEYGQIAPVYSISAGLDYPGVGPEHAYLHDMGRAEYVPVTDEEAVWAFEYLAKTEGIIPAIESAHAVAHAMKVAPLMSPEKIIVVTISGRGDKDCAAIARYRGEDIYE